MLRTIGKTSLLAAALCAAAHFGLFQAAVAQELNSVVEAQPIETQLETGQLETESCPDGAAAGQTYPYGTGGYASNGVFGPGGCLGAEAPNCRARYYGTPELFYNYYIPGSCGGVPANMYVAPRPVPAWVGHTYYTYQPYMPHELMYQHDRTYYRYYDSGRGMTRAHVSWYRPPFSGWYSNLRIAR